MNNRIGQQLGNYRLIRLLGQGGFAEVYLAEHIHLKTPAAVKLLYGKLTAHDVQAFLNEAQTIAALRHPHILRVLDFGFENRVPFLVMDYASGGTLRDHHPRGVSIRFPTLLSYAQQVASALAHAHTNKLIHRDVKPENMLVDANGTILLGDFGIVTIAHGTASMKTTDNIGTVSYMAPEHIDGKARPASDQYSLAIVIYEWLCGERPFNGSTAIEIAMHQIHDNPPSLCQKVPSLPPTIELVVFKALAKDPHQRFPDILTFVQALEQAAQSHRGNTNTQPPPGNFQQSLSTFFRQLFTGVEPTLTANPAPQSVTHPLNNFSFPVPQSAKYSVQSEPVLGVLPEEEILITYIQALPDLIYSSEIEPLASAMHTAINEHAAFFRQPGRERRVLEAFDKALFGSGVWGSQTAGKLALVKGKAEFLKVLGRYDDVLITYIRALPDLIYSSEIEPLASAMHTAINEYAAFFRQPGRGKKVLEAFDKALSGSGVWGSQTAGKLALVKGKAEFLKIFRGRIS